LEIDGFELLWGEAIPGGEPKDAWCRRELECRLYHGYRLFLGLAARWLGHVLIRIH
jgi:hypothetical protein